MCNGRRAIVYYSIIVYNYCCERQVNIIDLGGSQQILENNVLNL